MLATFIGAEAAAKQLGFYPDSVREWCARAGKQPADASGTADWKQLGELARSQVAAKLAGGKVTPVQAATIAAIADRNAREAPEADPETDADLEFMAALEEQFGEHATLALIFVIRRTEEGAEADEAWNEARTVDLGVWREQRAAEDHAANEAALARNARGREAWPRYLAGEITEAQRVAWS